MSVIFLIIIYFGAFLLGMSAGSHCAISEYQDMAAELGLGEYYLDEHNKRRFRFNEGLEKSQ